MNIQVGIITVSDRAAAGQYEDFGGPLVAQAADGYGWLVIAETFIDAGLLIITTALCEVGGTVAAAYAEA